MINLYNSNCFVSCDKNGMIKIWELSLYGEVRDWSVLNSNSDGVWGLGTNYLE